MKAGQVALTGAGREHDSDGRLVGLVYDRTPPLAAPDGNPRLVAVDSSDNALRVVAHAADQAVDMSACALHLVHVPALLSKEAAEAELVRRALGATARARATLDAAGLPWRLHVAMAAPTERIVERAVRCTPPAS